MMNRSRKWAPVCAATGLVMMLLLASHGVGQTPSAPPAPFKPVMPLLALMGEQDAHFDNIRELIRNVDAPERFEKLRHEALALAEMANINGYHRGSQQHEDYRSWASDLKQQAIEMAGQAEKKDVDAIKASAKKVIHTCKACHEQYQ